MQGILFFIVFFTKQNIGIFYILATIIQNICLGKLEKDKKKYIKTTIYELAIAGILLALSLLIMYYNGSLYNFIDYCFLGIGEFAKYNTVGLLERLTIESTVAIFILLTSLLLMNIFSISEKCKVNIAILFIYSLALLTVMYPIANHYHVTIANILLFVLALYILFIFIDLFKEKKIIKITGIITEVVCSIITILLFITAVANNVKSFGIINKDPGVYYGGILSDEKKENINNICNYIQQKRENGIEVKILSYKAMMYMTPLKINNKELDLAFVGNLGSKGEDGLISKISQMHNSEFLITKDEEDVIQESKNVRNYIIENMEQIGEIEEFYIYKNK